VKALFFKGIPLLRRGSSATFVVFSLFLSLPPTAITSFSESRGSLCFFEPRGPSPPSRSRPFWSPPSPQGPLADRVSFLRNPLFLRILPWTRCSFPQPFSLADNQFKGSTFCLTLTPRRFQPGSTANIFYFSILPPVVWSYVTQNDREGFSPDTPHISPHLFHGILSQLFSRGGGCEGSVPRIAPPWIPPLGFFFSFFQDLLPTGLERRPLSDVLRPGVSRFPKDPYEAPLSSFFTQKGGGSRIVL